MSDQPAPPSSDIARRDSHQLRRGTLGVLGVAFFVVSAAALRHMLADPLLPDELTSGAAFPRGWPGPALRADYERFDAAFKSARRTGNESYKETD